MQILSLVWGILAAIGMAVAFMPCFGSLNWLNIPFSGVGVIIGIVAIVSQHTGSKVAPIVGTILCAVAVVFGLVRLILGGGVV